MAKILGFTVPSIWTLLSAGFVLYMSYNLYQLYGLYAPKSCTGKGKNCIKSYLTRKDIRIQLRLYTSKSGSVYSNSQLNELWSMDEIDPTKTFIQNVSVNVPLSTRKNGSLYLHVYVLPANVSELRMAEWKVIDSAPLTKFAIPEANAFQLVGDTSAVKKPVVPAGNKPVSHWRSTITLSIMTDPFAFDNQALLPDVFGYLQIVNREYLPMLFVDEMMSRMKDFVPLNQSSKVMQLTVEYQPISIGKLRVWSAMSASMAHLTELGFSDKDLDEVKGLFVETNMHLLLLTMMISVCHLLFDFLAFKNDISYWRNKDDTVGLSTKAVVWRCFSTSVVFLFLKDQKTSYLVLVPMAIAAVIEYWKVVKALKVTVSWNGIELGALSEREQQTEALDDQAMRKLYFILFPLCVIGAVYSLLYTPHKSWYSWVVQSLVNGVYAFGFIFMLPQLYINYKMKSVAHLPLRAFMYKAFNTFIDDIFAFVITMPTIHRVACFRDDVVFVVYLYQRWLYPVDRTRVNEFGQSFDGSTPPDDDSKKTQ